MVNWSCALLSIGIRCYRASNYSTCRRVGLNFEFSTDHSGAIAHNAEPHSFFFSGGGTEGDPVIAYALRTNSFARVGGDYYRFSLAVFQSIATRLLRDPK